MLKKIAAAIALVVLAGCGPSKTEVYLNDMVGALTELNSTLRAIEDAESASAQRDKVVAISKRLTELKQRSQSGLDPEEAKLLCKNTELGKTLQSETREFLKQIFRVARNQEARDEIAEVLRPLRSLRNPVAMPPR